MERREGKTKERNEREAARGFFCLGGVQAVLA